VKEHTAIYMLHPGPTESRTLVEGAVLKFGSRSTVASFRSLDVPLYLGKPLTVYFREDRQFRKQEVEVVGIESGMDTELRLDLLPLGEPTLGEGRESERFALAYEGVTATFAGAEACPIVDVSEKGMAVVAGLELQVGQSVRCELRVGDEHFRGSCTIRSVAAMSGNQWRYGFTCDRDEAGDNLGSSLTVLLAFGARRAAAQPLSLS